MSHTSIKTPTTADTKLTIGSTFTHLSPFKHGSGPEPVEAVPLLVFSSSSLEEDTVSNPEENSKIQNVPHDPNEPEFLQCEPPFFIGAIDHFHPSSTNNDKDKGGSHSRLFIGMTLTELLHKFRSNQGIITPKEINELLDKIFPPRDFIFENLKYRSHVSKTPTSALDRLKIFEKFDYESELLTKHCGTKNVTSSASVLNDLIQELFDECLRQQIIENPQLGVLVLNLRNGFNRLLHTLTSLIESSQLKAMRVDTVLGTAYAKAAHNLKKEKKELASLEKQLYNLTNEVEKSRIRYDNERDNLEEKNLAELDYFQTFCTQAKRQVYLFEHPEIKTAEKNPAEHTGHHHHHGKSRVNVGAAETKPRIGMSMLAKIKSKASKIKNR